jgi:hypothetical protein
VRLRHDLVHILWDDAAELMLGWMDESEVEAKEMLVHTVGFLVRKTRKHIIVASTIGELVHCHAQFQIPRAMIRHITIIAKRGTEFPTTNEAPDAAQT